MFDRELVKGHHPHWDLVLKSYNNNVNLEELIMADKFFRCCFFQSGGFFTVGTVSASTVAATIQVAQELINMFCFFCQHIKTSEIQLFPRTGSYRVWDVTRWIVIGSVANVLGYEAVLDEVTDYTAAIKSFTYAILATLQLQWLPIYFSSVSYVASKSLRSVSAESGEYGLLGSESMISGIRINKPVINLFCTG
jgi:hypothetical protein